MERKSLSHLALSDDGFLFDSSSGNTFTLNSTGTFILRRIIESLDRRLIMARMMDIYDTSEDVLARDFSQFIQYLVELDILPQPEEEGNREA